MFSWMYFSSAGSGRYAGADAKACTTSCARLTSWAADGAAVAAAFCPRREQLLLAVIEIPLSRYGGEPTNPSLLEQELPPTVAA